MNADEFVQLISKLGTESKPYSLGTIDPNFDGKGKPRVQFDGESSPSSKVYPYLSPYKPVAGERVVLANIGTTHVILGAIENNNNGGWYDLRPSLVNGFTDYSSSAWSDLGCQKVGGVVYFTGLVVPPATMSYVTVLATIPPEFAPKHKQRLFGCPYNKSGTYSTAQVNVYPNGQVTLSTTACAGAIWLSLDGINYVVDSGA